MGLSVTQMAVGGFDKNFSYIVADDETKRAYIVDPAGDIGMVLDRIEADGLTLVGVLLTHTHFDHHEKLDALLASYAMPVYVHVAGANGISATDVHAIDEGDTFTIGESTIEVMHTPGHIADAVCFYIAAKDATDGVPKVITGDTLFVEGCGRTNERDVRKLYDSLERLRELPDETEVYPGHDYGSKPSSTIGYEKMNNKYFLAPDFDAFRGIRLG